VRALARFIAAAFVGTLSACVYDSNGPLDPFDRFPRVEGLWQIDAFVQNSTCGFVDDEPFVARIFQNRDILQISVDISGFGEIRYDGRLDEDGDFVVTHRTVFPDEAIRDEALVEGEFSFSGRTLSARETEVVTDLLTGQRCTIVWSWRGDRR
jgi:hypothetical protein